VFKILADRADADFYFDFQWRSGADADKGCLRSGADTCARLCGAESNFSIRAGL